MKKNTTRQLLLLVVGLLCANSIWATDVTSDIKTLKSFYTQYITNMLENKDDLNHALKKKYFVPTLIGEVAEMSKRSGADHVIRAQDVNEAMLKSLEVKPFEDQGWYMVSYSWDGKDTTSIPVKLEHIDGRTMIAYIMPDLLGTKYGNDISIKLSNKAIDLSLLYFSNNDSITKALKLLDEAIALDEHNVFAHGRKIEILRQNNRFDETLKAADEAIRCNPQSQYYGFYLLKGVVLEKIGRKEEAEAVYKKGLELSENRLKENPTVGTFVDSYFLRYSVYRTDIPNSEIIAAIPSSFTKEERERVVGFMEMVGSIKEFQHNFVGNNGRR